MKRVLTTDKANKPYGFIQPDGSGNIPAGITVSGTASYADRANSALIAVTASYALNGGGATIDTGSLATTGSNTFIGVQTITGSTGKSQYGDVQFPGYATLIDVHAVNEGPWIGRLYNDVFSTSSAALAYFAYDDGTFVFHNESTQSIGMQVNGYDNSTGLAVYENKVAFANNIEVTGSALLSGSVVVLATTPQNFPTASIGDVPGMVAFDKDYIYYCVQEFSIAGIVSHVYDVQGGIPWNAYHDPDTSWLQTGPSQEAGGELTPQVGWYFIDDTSTVRQLTSDNVWFGGQGPAPQPNGSGWICSANSNDWVYSDSNPTLTMYETNPIVTYWKRTPWNAITNQVTGSVEITGSLTVNGNVIDRPYKVYTALLTQKGESSLTTVNSGNLVVGATYQIITSSNGDWTNVGAPNNNGGTYFVATGTTPNSWGTAGELGYNGGAPEVVILENTLGNVWFDYEDVGSYYCYSDNLFTSNKVWAIGGNAYGYNTCVVLGVDNQSTIAIGTTQGNGTLLNTPIEIKVYN